MYIPHFIYPFVCWWALGLCISLLRQLEQYTQTGWLKQQKFVSSQFFRLKVLHQSLDWFSFWWGLSSQLAGDCFPPGSSYGLSCVCAHGREGAFSASSSFLLFSRSVVSDSLWPHGWQHARLPCPSVSQSLLKLMSIEAMITSNYLVLCWTIKKAERQRIDAFELWCWRRLESPLDSKEIKPVHPKGNQSWIFVGRTDAEAPVLWLPDAKSWLIVKYSDAGKDWGQEEKGATEDLFL